MEKNPYLNDLKSKIAKERKLENKLKQKTNRKEDLHVTIPASTKDKLDAKAKEENRSIANMLEIIIEKNC